MGQPSLIIDTLPPGDYLIKISIDPDIAQSLGYILLSVRCTDIDPNSYSCGDTMNGELSSSQPNNYRIIEIPQPKLVVFNFVADIDSTYYGGISDQGFIN